MYEALLKVVGHEVNIHVSSYSYQPSLIKGELSHVNKEVAVIKKNKKQFVVKLSEIIWFSV